MTATEPNFVTTYSPIVISFLALIVSGVSLYLSLQKFRMDRKKEIESNPNLDVRYEEGYKDKRGADRSIYSFLLSVTNLSDRANTIEKMVLVIEYRLPTGELVKFQCDNSIPADPSFDLGRQIEFPTLIGAGETVVGWSYFETTDPPAGGLNIVSYLVELRDSRGVLPNFRPVVLGPRPKKSSS